MGILKPLPHWGRSTLREALSAKHTLREYAMERGFKYILPFFTHPLRAWNSALLIKIAK
jgi:predicted xylose isomerase-like sugar epimerase